METPQTENTKPPYYGTADTKVKNLANTVLTSNNNGNWSVGDFLGLDNDGNNLYDLADYAVGDYRILSVAKEGNNMLVTRLTAGGRDNTVQATGAATGTYTNLGVTLTIPGVGLVTTNHLDSGGATNKARFYRMIGSRALAPACISALKAEICFRPSVVAVIRLRLVGFSSGFCAAHLIAEAGGLSCLDFGSMQRWI